MLNWTEEDVKFVVTTMIMPCIEESVKQSIKFDEMPHESYTKIFNKIADRIREIDYERQRDKSFFFQYVNSLDGMQEMYDAYCKAYDKLNRHLLTGKETDLDKVIE